MIRLDIIADYACPWCHLGKAMLDRALEARPDHPFVVEWHPYQLDPNLPRAGMDRIEYLKARFGSVDKILEIHEPLLKAAEAAGVELNLPAIERAPNTLDAHRLTHWAAIEGRQAAVVSALYRAYWREGQDIGDPATLVRIATQAGMDGAMVERLLASDADVQAIRARVDHARARGVQSVPAFIIADHHVVFGAQQPAFWNRVIDDLLAAAAAQAEGQPDA